MRMRARLRPFSVRSTMATQSAVPCEACQAGPELAQRKVPESPRKNYMTEREERGIERDSTDGRIERAKDAALGAHHGDPSLGDEIGEATGGIAGVLLGAGIGSSAGPVGTLLGGIAGAIGGWWTGRAISEAAEKLNAEDDEGFRAHYESSNERLADRSYDDFRAAYYL